MVVKSSKYLWIICNYTVFFNCEMYCCLQVQVHVALVIQTPTSSYHMPRIILQTGFSLRQLGLLSFKVFHKFWHRWVSPSLLAFILPLTLFFMVKCTLIVMLNGVDAHVSWYTLFEDVLLKLSFFHLELPIVQ